MSKTIQLFSIFLIIFALLMSGFSVYASDINMNLEPNDVDSNIVDENDIENTDSTQNPTDNNSSVPPSSTGSVANEGLGFSNILSILLLTVGVILILLAIAIIIRLK